MQRIPFSSTKIAAGKLPDAKGWSRGGGLAGQEPGRDDFAPDKKSHRRILTNEVLAARRACNETFF
jgi:hypothetical protein